MLMRQNNCLRQPGTPSIASTFSGRSKQFSADVQMAISKCCFPNDRKSDAFAAKRSSDQLSVCLRLPCRISRLAPAVSSFAHSLPLPSPQRFSPQIKAFSHARFPAPSHSTFPTRSHHFAKNQHNAVYAPHIIREPFLSSLAL